MKIMNCLIVSAVLMTVFASVSAERDCSLPCPACPRTPTCAPGVSLVADECGCCKVCARQLHESCDSANKCDHHKNLYCSFGDIDDNTGICVAKPGRSCHMNGKVYLNGESFAPSCKVVCTCIDSAVGCTPQCPMRLKIPRNCDHPRLVKKPGQCCEEWVCVDGKNAPEIPELRHAVRSNESPRGITVNRYEASPFGVAAAHGQQEIGLTMRAEDDCMVQTTPWSPCSKTCGWGVSERVTNDNKACKLRKESRLCQLRPCSEDFTAKIKRGKKCVRTPKATRPVRYSFSGCKSKVYTPKYCGQCVDGRCCSPERTKTATVTFHCDDGFSFKKEMMFIKSCSCHKCSGSDNDIFNSFRGVVANGDTWNE